MGGVRGNAAAASNSYIAIEKSWNRKRQARRRTREGGKKGSGKWIGTFVS